MSIKIKCIGILNFVHHISQILCCTVFAHCLHFILALRFAWKLAPSPLVAVRLISLCLVSETISSNISPSPRTSLWDITTFGIIEQLTVSSISNWKDIIKTWNKKIPTWFVQYLRHTLYESHFAVFPTFLHVPRKQSKKKYFQKLKCVFTVVII